MKPRLICLLVLSALLSGCFWSRARINDPEIVERAKTVRPGVTSAEELPQILKVQPTRKRTTDGVTTFEYSYSDAKTETFSLILFSFTRTEDVTETLYVETDAETGRVIRVPKLDRHEPEWRWWPFGDGD